MTDDSETYSGNHDAPEQQQYQYGRKPPPPPPPPPPQSGTGWGFNAMTSCLVAGCVTVLVPVLLVFGFMLLMYVLLSSGLEDATTGSFASFVQTAGHQNLRERVIREGKSGAGTIAIVAIHGAIDGSGSALDSDGSLSFVSRQLRAAREDKNVKAVILQIDSPGGGLTPSDQIYNEVQRLRREGKPVLAWAGGMMMSGGYYIAVAADKIMANPTSTVGSIGVLLQHFQVDGMLGKLGVKVSPITSGEHKDIASPFREMTAEERRMLQEYVDESHRRFVGIVAKGRDLPEERVKALADGGIFTADMAKERGLVDSIGYIEDAVAWSEKAANEENMRIIGYRRLLAFGDIFAEAGRGAAATLLEAAGRETPAPRATAVYGGGK